MISLCDEILTLSLAILAKDLSGNLNNLSIVGRHAFSTEIQGHTMTSGSGFIVISLWNHDITFQTRQKITVLIENYLVFRITELFVDKVLTQTRCRTQSVGTQRTEVHTAE